MTKDYMKLSIEEIALWCKENGKQDWLLAKLEETKTVPVYPAVESVSKTGKKTHKQDKKQSPIGETTVNLSFFDIKRAFCEEFMQDMLPKKKGGTVSMADKVKIIFGMK